MDLNDSQGREKALVKLSNRGQVLLLMHGPVCPNAAAKKKQKTGILRGNVVSAPWIVSTHRTDLIPTRVGGLNWARDANMSRKK